MPDRRCVAVTGAGGFIGTPLVRQLEAAGLDVITIGRGGGGTERGGRRAPDVVWDPASETLDSRRIEGIDGVVHLAGEPIGQRWTEPVKRRIRDSRIQGTQFLARVLSSLSHRPRVLVSMSAIGIYGDRGDEVLDEESRTGGRQGFLAAIGEAWEKAADPAREAGIRVVHPRLGIVLHSSGGALERMLLPFRLGAGARIGDGRQWMSWIARTDAVGALVSMLDDESLRGAVNVTAPVAVRNADFTRVLANHLRRPALLVVPELAMRMMYGEMGVETVVGGQRVIPRKLQDAGFRFRARTLDEALAMEIE
ncbi:MAG: TIGR01777 family oxidoreductase [Gemmatimonadota bacterium]